MLSSTCDVWYVVLMALYYCKIDGLNMKTLFGYAAEGMLRKSCTGRE